MCRAGCASCWCELPWHSRAIAAAPKSIAQLPLTMTGTSPDGVLHDESLRAGGGEGGYEKGCRPRRGVARKSQARHHAGPAFHLLGLAWANAAAASTKRAARALARTQRATAVGTSSRNGFGRLGHRAGALCPEQRERWIVAYEIALHLQPFFESGLSCGHDQWISGAGTSWAAMALSLTVEPRRISRASAGN